MIIVEACHWCVISRVIHNLVSTHICHRDQTSKFILYVSDIMFVKYNIHVYMQNIKILHWHHLLFTFKFWLLHDLSWKQRMCLVWKYKYNVGIVTYPLPWHCTAQTLAGLVVAGGNSAVKMSLTLTDSMLHFNICFNRLHNLIQKIYTKEH